MRGSRNGAMVGMTLIRTSPASGWPLDWTSSDNSSASRRMRWALATTALPSGVKRTLRLVRSTRVTPSRPSRSRRPAERVDCETKLASAALPKCPCSWRATRYCSCLRVGWKTVTGPPHVWGGGPPERRWRGLSTAAQRVLGIPLRQPCGLPPPHEWGGFLRRRSFLDRDLDVRAAMLGGLISPGGVARGLFRAHAQVNLVDVGHLQPSAQDGEGELSLHQLQRIAAELLEPPAFQQGKVLAHAGSQQLEIVGAGEQAGGDVDLAGADLEEELQQIGDERALLAERGAARGARGEFLVAERLGV